MSIKNFMSEMAQVIRTHHFSPVINSYIQSVIDKLERYVDVVCDDKTAENIIIKCANEVPIPKSDEFYVFVYQMKCSIRMNINLGPDTRAHFRTLYRVD